jgi:hypothetical protein
MIGPASFVATTWSTFSYLVVFEIMVMSKTRFWLWRRGSVGSEPLDCSGPYSANAALPVADPSKVSN